MSADLANRPPRALADIGPSRRMAANRRAPAGASVAMRRATVTATRCEHAASARNTPNTGSPWTNIGRYTLSTWALSSSHNSANQIDHRPNIPSARSLHEWPPRGDRDGECGRSTEGRNNEDAGQKACHSEHLVQLTHAAYALRCADRTCPFGPDSKVIQKKKPQVKCLTWGSPWSRLRDSNPRPTHYEYASDHAASFQLVPLSAVLPDQVACHRLSRGAPYRPVQRRPRSPCAPLQSFGTSAKGQISQG